MNMAVVAITPEEAAEAVGNFLGLPPLAAADFTHLALAAVTVAAIASAAHLVRGRICGWLDRVVSPKLGFDDRISIGSKHMAAAIATLGALALLRLVFAAYRWPDYSELLFDIAIAATAALVAWHLSKAFKVSRSVALALAFICGFWVLSDRYEQLGWVENSLDGFAVSLGATRLSLLDLASVAFAAVVLYALARLAIRAARTFIRRRPGLDTTQSLLAEKIATIAIVVVTIFVAIDLLGIDTTALSIFSGTIGLGLGFGLQKIFSNLASGIILLMDRSIKPGDVIVVGESVGKVNRIGTRAVSMITRDGKEHLIPNELLMTERVENWSFSSRDIRIRMAVRVAYDS